MAGGHEGQTAGGRGRGGFLGREKRKKPDWASHQRLKCQLVGAAIAANLSVMCDRHVFRHIEELMGRERGVRTKEPDIPWGEGWVPG